MVYKKEYLFIESDYSKIKKISGIYMIENLLDNKKYIGSSINLRVSIKRCCQNKLKTAFGHKWKYKNGL